MRMWMVNPRIMCWKHLNGEHVETHMFVGTLMKGKRIDGYVKKDLLEIKSLRRRHDELANEMIRRNCNHNSPLPEISWECIKEKYYKYYSHRINSNKSFKELISRCPRCRQRAEKLKGVIEMELRQTTLEEFGLKMEKKKDGKKETTMSEM